MPTPEHYKDAARLYMLRTINPMMATIKEATEALSGQRFKCGEGTADRYAAVVRHLHPVAPDCKDCPHSKIGTRGFTRDHCICTYWNEIGAIADKVESGELVCPPK